MGAPQESCGAPIPGRAEHSPIGPFAVAFALRSARRATAGGVRSNYATGHQPAATATALLLLLAERREENHLADCLLVGEQHRQLLDAAAPATRRRHAHLQRFDVILVEELRLVVPARPLARLILEAHPLIQRIVQLAEGIAHLQAARKELEALGGIWLTRLALG